MWISHRSTRSFPATRPIISAQGRSPGAVANAAWSSIVVLPSGLVLNAQIVDNGSGAHDRVTAVDLKARTVTLSILDGVQGGKQYFYHLVTDASAPVPAVLEKGVYAPRLAEIPAFGKSLPNENSALLGFSPVLNGRTDEGSGEDQGFSTALAHGIDPINVFPVGPENTTPPARTTTVRCGTRMSACGRRRL